MRRVLRSGVALWLAACVAGCGRSAAPSLPSLPADQPGAPSQPQSGPTPTLLSLPLVRATPRVIALPAAPASAAIPLDGSLDAWRGAPSHLAGTAHYDQGEWIYEDYPLTAYGAAASPTPLLYTVLDGLSTLYDPAQRLPGGLAVAIAQAGAGPLVDEADLYEMRFAVRGSDLYVLARTTTMHDPVRTALLLLFDTGHAGTARAVPFGSGLTTQLADTAVLITASGARIVDLASGDSTDAPAVANASAYVNALQTRLPLSRVGLPDGAHLRLVAATGLAAAGSFEFDAGGSAGPLAKVVPRFDEPVQSVHERMQALALAAHDIDRFITEVSLERLRAGDSERLLPGIGYSVRTFVAPEARGTESGTDGTLRDYGLYLPLGYAGAPAPATLVLRGSGMTGHSLAAITPGLFQNLGDDNGAILVSPGGRSGFDMFLGMVYLDAMQALADAQALLPIDAERLTLAGYSMGGNATYMFAATQPERFAGAFVIAGPVGGAQPATSLYSLTDVVPSLINLLHTPIEIFQGDIDADVPLSNALAAVLRLRGLGYRYRFNLLPANTHFSPGILNDYSIGARYLRVTRRANAPARVIYSRSMPFERSVDTGETTDQPAAGISAGLTFDHAWFVQNLQATDPVNGIATVDVRMYARPSGAVMPVLTAGIDTGPLLGQVVSPYQEQAWAIGPVIDAPRNAMDAQLTGVGRVRFDLAGMELSLAQVLMAAINTDAITSVEFAQADHGCVALSLDGVAVPVQQQPDAIVVELTPGDHILQLRPCV